MILGNGVPSVYSETTASMLDMKVKGAVASKEPMIYAGLGFEHCWCPSTEAGIGAWRSGLEPQAVIRALRVGLANWSLQATI